MGCQGVRCPSLLLTVHAEFLCGLNSVERKLLRHNSYFFQNVCVNADVSEKVHQYKMNNNVFGEVKHSQNIMSLLVHIEYPVFLIA